MRRSLFLLPPLLLIPLTSCAPRLTAEQRRQDIEFLAQWAIDNSPTVPVNESYGGSPGVEALRSRYRELAEQAKDNNEFVRIIYGYFSLIGELGHGYIYPKENLSGLMWESFLTGAGGMAPFPWHQFPRAMYWSDLLEKSFIHPPFRVRWKAGQYLVADDWKTWFVTIPRGSRILHVNGMTCPEYVRHLKETTWLHSIAGDTGWIDRQLLVVPEKENFRGWDIEFALPDDSRRRMFVPAEQGRTVGRSTEYLDWKKGNCICLELTDTIGYIRIKAMVHSSRTADEKRIRGFLSQAKNGYDKLIIDVRSNGGGSTFYVYDTLIRPFLREPVSYRQITGVRKKYLAEMKPSDQDRLRKGVSTWAWETKVEPHTPPKGFDPNDWSFFEISRQIQPSNPYDFNGRLYILIDRGSGSATETYSDAVKRTGLGTLVGEPTAGALGNYFMADTIRLPASGMIVRLEADLDLNSDGSVQERVGTKPDIVLGTCELPEVTIRETLRDDPWIHVIVNDL